MTPYAALSVAFFADGLVVSILTAFLPEYVTKDLQYVSGRQLAISLMSTLFGVGSLVSVPLWSFISHKLSCRRAFLVATTLNFTVTLLPGIPALPHTMPLLCLYRLLQGVGSMGMWTITLLYVGLTTEIETVENVLGRMAVWVNVGILLGPLAGAFLFVAVSIWLPFLVLACCLLLALILLWYSVPPDVRRSNNTTEPQPGQFQFAHLQPDKLLYSQLPPEQLNDNCQLQFQYQVQRQPLDVVNYKRLMSMLCDKDIFLLSGIIFLTAQIICTVDATIPLYLNDTLNSSVVIIGLVVFGYGFGTSIGTVFADNARTEETYMLYTGHFLLAALLPFLAVPSLLYELNGLAIAIEVLALLGIGFATSWLLTPCLPLLVRQCARFVAPDAAPIYATVLQNAMLTIGMICGPMVAAVVVSFLSFFWTMVLYSLSLILSLFIVLLVYKPQRTIRGRGGSDEDLTLQATWKELTPLVTYSKELSNIKHSPTDLPRPSF